MVMLIFLFGKRTKSKHPQRAEYQISIFQSASATSAALYRQLPLLD